MSTITNSNPWMFRSLDGAEHQLDIPVNAEIWGANIFFVGEQNGHYGKYGLLDDEGNIVAPAVYNDIFSFSPKYFGVREEDETGNCKYGLIDRNGDVVLPIEYDKIHILGTGSVSPDAAFGYFCKGETTYLMRNDLSVIRELNCKIDDYSSDSKCIVYIQDNKCGLLDPYGNTLIEPHYDRSCFHHEKGQDYVLFGENGLCGMMTLQGNVVLEPKFSLIYSDSLENGLLKVHSDINQPEEKVDIIEVTTGRVVAKDAGIQSKLGEAYIILCESNWCFDDDGLDGFWSFDAPYSVIDLMGNQILPYELDEIEFHNEYFAVCKNEKWGAYDLHWSPVLPMEFSSENAIAKAYRENILKGNAPDKEIEEPFEQAPEPEGTEKCVHTPKGIIYKLKMPEVSAGWMFRGFDGEERQIELPTDARLWSYTEELAPAIMFSFKDENGLDKCGLLKANGLPATDAIYDAIDPLGQYGAGFVVHLDGKHGVINPNGEMILPLEHEEIYDYFNDEYRFDTGQICAYTHRGGKTYVLADTGKILQVLDGEVNIDLVGSDIRLMRVSEGNATPKWDWGRDILFEQDGKWGKLDACGNIHAPAQFTRKEAETMWHDDSLMSTNIRLEGKNYLCDIVNFKTGRTIIKDISYIIPTRILGSTSEAVMIAAGTYHGTPGRGEREDCAPYGILSPEGDFLVPWEYDEIEYKVSHFAVRKGDKWGAYNWQGKLILPIEYDKAEDLDGHILSAFLDSNSVKCAETDALDDQIDTSVLDAFIRNNEVREFILTTSGLVYKKE